MFKVIMREKRNELKFSINRLKTGLDKLMSANEEVANMQVLLTNMQPELEKAAIETENVMKKLEVDKKEADETQRVVALEEIEAQKQETEARELAREAELAVEEANIMLNKTMEEVQKLKKEHLVEVKALPNPPRACVIVLGGMVILCLDAIKEAGGNIIMKNVEGGMGKKEEDYFNTAKQYLLNDTKWLMDFMMK